MSENPPPPRIAPASTRVLKNALKYGALLALIIAVVGAVLGGIFAGIPGIVGALVGTGMALTFLGVTAASILFANRFIGSELFVGAFFGIVLGSWLVKFAVFIVLSLLLKDQPWVDPLVLFLAIVAGIVGSLTVDVVVVARSRTPYASDVVPSVRDEPGSH